MRKLLREVDLIDPQSASIPPVARSMQQWSAVLGGKHAVRILVVRSWTIDLAPIERSLRSAGIEAAITRVDFQAALEAALVHDRFDAVIYDPSTPDLSLDTVKACLKRHKRDAPVLELESVPTIGAQIAGLLAPYQN